MGYNLIMGICAFCYICNLFGVMVLQRSIVNWKRGNGSYLPWVMVSHRCYAYH